MTPTPEFEAYILKRALHPNHSVGADKRCNCYLAGAREARKFLLANDPVVEVEKALRALLRVRSEETIAIAECALNDLEDARGTK